MNISVCFTAPKKWTLLSWLIKLFTKSKVSHAALCVDVYGTKVLLHSTMGGVQFTHRKKYERNDNIVEEYLIKEDVSSGLNHAINEHLGDNYDYVGLLGYAYLLVLWRWLKIKVKNPMASPTALVCSEFVLHINHEGKISEWNGIDPERTTAQDLLVKCRNSLSFERLM